MKLIQSVFFYLLLTTTISFPCFAQSDELSTKLSGQIAEQDAKVWKEFSSPEGRFTIIFPGTPAYQPQTVGDPGMQFKLHIHNLRTAAEYSVMYADYPFSVSDPAMAKSVLDNGAKGAVASVNSELIEFKEIALGSAPGRYLKEKMPHGEIMQVKMYLVGQRMYQIAVTLPGGEKIRAGEMKMYEEAAEKFLESFRTLWTKQEGAK